jgi:hypothetical protein
MAELSSQTLLSTPVATIRDVVCRGTCRHRSAEECARATHLVFPYRGVYVRHVGRTDTVAEPNQLLFFKVANLIRSATRWRAEMPVCRFGSTRTGCAS